MLRIWWWKKKNYEDDDDYRDESTAADNNDNDPTNEWNLFTNILTKRPTHTFSKITHVQWGATEPSN